VVYLNLLPQPNHKRIKTVPVFSYNRSKGFTLIEILLAIAISSVVMLALYQTFNLQQKTYIVQDDVASMQQSLRTAMLFLSSDIRMAGYDPLVSGNFAILNIAPKNQNSSIQFQIDLNENGMVDGNETLQYSVADLPISKPDGSLDLARNNGGGRQLLSENIYKFGLAFAFDNDIDGELDTYTAGSTQQIIWAVDSDEDNFLDTRLDTNSDGTIDIHDSPGLNGINGINTGVMLGSIVSVNKIRAVRVWLLVETDRIDLNFNGTTTYVIGQYIVTLDNNKKRRLLTATIKCRNPGLY